MKKVILSLAVPFFILSCGDKTVPKSNSNATTSQPSENKTQLVGPTFNENNAYQHIKTQVDFGPRVPGTESHKKAAEWLSQEMGKWADTTIVQNTTILLGDKKTKVPCYNIIGSFNPNAERRILLLAHWDTRPWADMDYKERDKPIDGADDGGSGTGVLLELARLFKESPLPADLGIDILLADVEDYAKSEWGEQHGGDPFALGTQYWAKNPHVKNYKADFGILLDMVGGRDARFAVELYSKQYAGKILAEVWNTAHSLGYQKYFVFENGGAIYDDHIPVNQILGIPTIDIINQPKNSTTGFVGHWHTHDDNISNIDAATLKVVGQTLVQHIYGLHKK